MIKRILLAIAILFSFTKLSFSQNINYQLEVRFLGWDGRYDGVGQGTPEYTYLVTPTDNINGAGSQFCYYTGDNPPGTDINGGVNIPIGGNFHIVGPTTTSRIRTINNTTASSIDLNMEAFEKDCNNDCSFESCCGSLFGICYQSDNSSWHFNGTGIYGAINFKNDPPCQWNNYGIIQVGTGGSAYYIAVRIRWEYTSVNPGSIGAFPSPYFFCGLGVPPTIATAGLATQYAVYQWQYQDNCSGPWTNIQNTDSTNYTPPPSLTISRCYQRVASVCQIAGGSISAATNTYTTTLTSTISGNTIGTSQNFCALSAPAQTLTGSNVSGGAGAPYWYDWEGSTDGGITWTPLQHSSSILSYTTGALTGDNLYRRETYSNANIAGCHNFSNVIDLNVTPPIGSNTITGNQTLCGTSTPFQLLGSALTGGAGPGTILVDWQQNTGSGWVSIFGANSQSYSPQSVSVTTQYRRVLSSGACTDISNTVTVTILPEIANNSITGNQTYCSSGTPPTFTGTTPTGGNGTYTYLWEQSLDGSTFSAASGTNNAATYSSGNLTVTTYYRRMVSSGVCSDISNRITIAITPPITSNIITGNQLNCDTLFNPNLQNGSFPGGGTGAYLFTWIQSTDGGATWTVPTGGFNVQSYQPLAIGKTTLFRRIASSGACIDTSNIDTITIIPALKNNVVSSYQRFCFSGTPAQITGNIPTGGNGTLSYSWESSLDQVTWATIVGANSQNYTPPSPITITTYYRRTVHSSVCSSISNISKVAILQLPIVTQLQSTNLTCYQSHNGTITVTGNSFNGSIHYSIDSGRTYQNAGNYTLLDSNSYYVYVKDDSACLNTYNNNPVLLTQPTKLTFTTTKADASCASVQNGQINVSATGGTPSYSYSVNYGAPQSSNVFAGLGAGTYVVGVYDRNGCQDTASVIINNAYSVTASIDSQVNVSCFGGNNGLVRGRLTGGIPPLSFSINNIVFQSDSVFSGLSAGSYLLSIKDSKGCSDVVPVNITEPIQLIVRVDSVVANLCNGGNRGKIYITASGGTGAYSYLWSNAVVSRNDTGLVVGTYTVTVTDIKGCTAVASATINQPSLLYLNIASFNNLLCNGDSSGSVYLTANGGTPPYAYHWSNGSAYENQIKLPANTYTVTVTDTNGCAKTISQLITEPQLLATVISDTNVTCNGAKNGAVVFDVTGGTTPYSYLWSNGDTSKNLTAISGGTYTVQATDHNGCGISSSIVVAEPSPLTTIFTLTNVLCKGAATGVITVTVSGGTTPYRYLWSNGDTTNIADTLSGGTYKVTITDAHLCVKIDSATITEPLQAIAGVVNATDISCNGRADGSVNVVVFGGTFPYSYYWSNGAPSQNINHLSANTYYVTVTDKNGCTFAGNDTVFEPALLVVTHIDSNVTCFGGNNGKISLTVIGGTVPYSYMWSTFDTSKNIQNLTAGRYTYMVSDANGCQVWDTTTITEPAALVLTLTDTNVNCNGGNTGSITSTVSGGTGIILYNWSTTAISPNLTGITAGSYSLTITDGNTCTASAATTITQPLALVMNSTTTNVACFGGGNGAVDVTINGGTLPYRFHWSTGDTTQNVHGLSDGSYSLTATDGNNCTITRSFIITEPRPIHSHIVDTNVTCHGAANGSMTVIIDSGGVSPYSYLWSTFQSSAHINGLNGGTYYVIITDANGCEKRDSATITEPAALVLTLTDTNVNCNGGNTGSITSTVSGGIGIILYNWSTSAISHNLSGIPAGSYSLTITDGNTCTATAATTITQPLALVMNSTTTNVACFGGGNGAVDVTINGGTLPYRFHWSTGDTTQNVHGLSGGSYSLTATDGNNCTITRSFIITEPHKIYSHIVDTNVTCHGAANGSITVIIDSGGVSPYSYLWSTFQSSAHINGLNGGTYYVIITDANGCEKRDSATITEPAALVLTLTDTNVNCNGGNTGSITSTVSGGTGIILYSWSTSAISHNLSGIPAGSYSLTITDGNICTATASTTITQPLALVMNSTTTNVACFGGGNGAVDVTINGGTLPYRFHWSTGDTTQNVHGLSGGSYSLTATDGNNCTITRSFIITEPRPIHSHALGTKVTCHAAADGTAIVTVDSGGTAPFTYLWSNFQGSPAISGLNGGTYFVIITDFNGCTKRDSVLIAEPARLNVTDSVNQITCFNANNGSIYLNVTGGTLGYHYSWSGGQVTQNIISLSAGYNSVTVTDTNSCTVTIAAIIVNPQPMSFNYNIKTPTCNSGNTGPHNDGFIKPTIVGGTPGYQYSWADSFGNTNNLKDWLNIGAGYYHLTVTDFNNCTASDSVPIREPDLFYTSGIIHSVTCHGDKNGEILLNTYGGTPPYQYYWSDSSVQQDRNHLSGGIYRVTPTDHNGCEVYSQYSVFEPDSIQLRLIAVNNLCAGQSNGSVTAIGQGGLRPYQYLWQNFVTDSFQNGVASGLYHVELIDSVGCHRFDSIAITAPLPLQIAGVVTNESCNGKSDGKIITTISGGVRPYTSYTWSNGAITKDLTGVPAGTYTITVRDTNGCTMAATFTITQQKALVTNVSLSSPVCNGGNTGFVSIAATGGDEPYSYVWNTTPAQNGATATNLIAGSYIVTVTDSAGCVKLDSAALSQPSPIVVSPTSTQSKCFNTSSGTVTVGVTGGHAPYTYILNGISQASNVFTGLSIGNYVVIVHDANGCDGTGSFQVTAPTSLAVHLITDKIVVLSGMSVMLSAITTDTGVVSYTWSAMPTGTTFNYDSLCNGDSVRCSTVIVKPLITTLFSVQMRNSDSCVAEDTIRIDVLNHPSAFFPSAFTPNGDGLNDRFEFDILGATNIDVKIYDRFGELIYSNPSQPNGINNQSGWDGTWKGKVMPTETYVYQLMVTYYDGHQEPKSGTVTLLH